MTHDSHAYLQVRALRHGAAGWEGGKPGGHGKNFGTMIHAVNRRAWDLFGFKGDPMPYLRHHYAYDNNPRPAPDDPRLAPRQPGPSKPPPSRNRTRPTLSPMNPQDLYDEALRDITLDSGTEYACTNGDLDATGGLARQQYPHNDDKDHPSSRKKWFLHRNHGPFRTPRQACLEIFTHNDLRRKPGTAEREAIERLSKAISAGRHGLWGPDVIIKAFCDLDVVFFRGRLRGHVCVRWLPDWSAPGCTIWGTTVFLGDGKCAIRLNVETILIDHPRPFERMFATMLHEMW